MLFDQVEVEPTDESFLDAIAFANEGRFDGYVAVGGGSTIDTAKAVNLYTTYPPADCSTTSIRRSARGCRCPVR